MVRGRLFVSVVVTPDATFVDFVAIEKGTFRPDLWRVPLLGGTPRRLASDVWPANGMSQERTNPGLLFILRPRRRLHAMFASHA